MDSSCKGEGYELVFWNGARGIRARLSTAERATALDMIKDNVGRGGTADGRMLIQGGERGLTKALVKNT